MAITWDQTTFNRTYGDATGTGLGKTFAGDATWWRRYYEQRIVPVFGNITGAQRILVVGCGLGLLVSAVQSTGFANIWGIDRSHDVALMWPASHPRLAELDVLSTSISAQLNTAFGRNTFHWVITESVVEGYPPAEQAALYAACEALLVQNQPASHVVHLVHPGVDMEHWPINALENGEFASWAGTPMATPGCPARTMAEWQASRTTHTFLSMIGVM